MPPLVAGTASSDPYQIVAPASFVAPAGLVPVDSQVYHSADPYALAPAPTLGTATSPPAAGQNVQGATGLFSGPLFQGGPIYNTVGHFDPLIPELRNRIESRLSFRAEYLLWDVTGMDTPPLVTTSPNGTGQGSAAVLGQPGTSVAFGGDSVNDGSVSGFLLGGGWWITPQRNVAIEMEYFQLDELDDGYNGSSDGAVILGRPYVDVSQGVETAELIAYPGLVGGDIRVGSETDLRSFLIDARVSLCPAHGVCCQNCGLRNRTDWIIGYRNIRLRDSLAINENRRSLVVGQDRTIASSDQFQTTNQFHGLQLGIVRRRLLQRAWLETSMRVAIGNIEQTLRVSGSTTINDQGSSATYGGGLLAQTTNGGTRSRDEFGMIPELGIRLGFRLTDRLHAHIGYTVLYLPNVIRASEQIDRDIHPGLIPPGAGAVSGVLRPAVAWDQSDYLAHGLQLGGELNF
nr:BBP7 family outer membrane beta-barrel protein [Rhodopirellula sp. JC639]